MSHPENSKPKPGDLEHQKEEVRRVFEQALGSKAFLTVYAPAYKDAFDVHYQGKILEVERLLWEGMTNTQRIQWVREILGLSKT